MSESADSGDISLEKLTRVYIKMRDKKLQITKELEGQVKAIEADMEKVKWALLDRMKSLGVDSLRTDAGLVYRTVRTTYSTNDWEAMGKFVVENNLPQLLEKRLHQGNVRAFLEENPETLPPGLNTSMEYSVTIKRSKND